MNGPKSSHVTCGAKACRGNLNGSIIGTTKTLDTLIDSRFYWAPLLEKVAHCVTPNIQITSLEGAVEDDKGITITLDGVAGGREPRGVAEDFRQMLLEQIGKGEPSVKVEFKTLEDLDTTVSVGGNNVTTAHFVVMVGLDPFPKPGKRRPPSEKASPRRRTPNLNKEQTKRLMLGGFGLIGLLYVYFTFFLGPLNNSRNSIQGKINELEQKIATSKAEISKATKLEESAHAATVRYDAMRALSPDGAPIAWFPPRMKTFFAGQQIDKVTTRLEGNNAFKEKELAGWNRYLWIVDLPQADFGSLGKAIALLENSNPLLSIRRLRIHAAANDPEMQEIVFTASTIIDKK